MRTANNSNFTVEALVAKYRNFVEDHATYNIIGDDGLGIGIGEYGIDGWADHQLLIKLYNDVAGENADSSIQDRLSKYEEHFWKDVLDSEEYTFLVKNFKDTVDFIFSKGLHYGSDLTRNSIALGMTRGISFIKKAAKYVTAKPGNCIYLENDTLGDGSMQFPQCVILCDDNDSDESALKKIRLFAAGIQYRNIDKIEEETIDIIISGSIWFSNASSYETLYASLANNGTMVLQAHPRLLVSMDKDDVSFRKRLVADKVIKSIAKYEKSESIFQYVIVIEKREHAEVDIQDWDIQQTKKVDIQQITARILLPGYYLTEKPEKGLPLSEFLENYDFKHVEQSVSIEQFVVFPNNLGSAFKDADLIHKSFKKGTEYGLTPDNPASDCYNVDFPSILLYGDEKNVYAGLASKVDLPYAVLNPIACFTAKEGVDLRYVASLLFEPIVAKQISAIYLDFFYGDMMDLMPEFLHSIIVPSHDVHERDRYLADACYNALLASQVELRQENEFYRKAVSMRKHALTQSLTSIEAMFYALNAYREMHDGMHNEDKISRVDRTTVREAFDFIDRSLKDMMPALEHIAAVEYTFGKPEWIDPERFIEEYVERNKKGWINFRPVFTWEKGHNQAHEDIYGEDSNTGRRGRLLFAKGEPLDLFLFPKDALIRVFNNIVSNAQAHGFTDDSRNDYRLRFSWHMDGMALIVEVENNGCPIPADRDVSSLLEYGVSTNLHHDGHNGIGCNEIDDIMQRYEGKVEIVSLPSYDFPVKYILTFNRSNSVGAIKL